MDKQIRCVNCGATMSDGILPRHVIGTYQADTVVCEHVPIERCTTCGQIYFPARVAEVFEQIRQGSVKPDHTVTLTLAACELDELLVTA